MTKRIVTSSEIDCFQTCRKKYQYRYLEKYRSLKRVTSMEIGKAVHLGLDAWYSGGGVQGAIYKALDYLRTTDLSVDDAELVAQMLQRYADKYPTENFSVVYIESKFLVPVLTPRNYRSRNFMFAGVIDGLVRKSDGSYWLLEHKTASSIGDNYFLKLETDFQIRAYIWALRQLGYDVKGVIYNVLRTKLPTIPQILKKGGLSQAKNIDTTYDVYLDAIYDNGLDPADYQEILDILREKGDTFFSRQEYPVDQYDVEEFQEDLYRITRDMHTCRHFYRNGSACNNWSGCAYRKLCTGEVLPSEIDEHFVIAANANPELHEKPDIQPIGEPIGTNLNRKNGVVNNNEFIADFIGDEILEIANY